MHGIAGHMYFERRRLTMAGILSFIAGFALHAHVNSLALGLPFPVFTGFLYAVFVVLAATVTTYILPKWRRLIDFVAMSRLCFAFWVIGVHGQEIAASPLASATIVVGGAIFLQWFGDRIDTMNRALGAPVIILNVTARARAFFAWIDNRTEREGGTNVVSISNRSTTGTVIGKQLEVGRLTN